MTKPIEPIVRPIETLRRDLGRLSLAVGGYRQDGEVENLSAALDELAELRTANAALVEALDHAQSVVCRFVCSPPQTLGRENERHCDTCKRSVAALSTARGGG